MKILSDIYRIVVNKAQRLNLMKENKKKSGTKKFNSKRLIYVSVALIIIPLLLFGIDNKSNSNASQSDIEIVQVEKNVTIEADSTIVRTNDESEENSSSKQNDGEINIVVVVGGSVLSVAIGAIILFLAIWRIYVLFRR